MNQYVTGEVIKEMRKQKHMTQLQLADHLGVTDKTVSKWENGKDSGYAILAELVNSVQNRPNAVYAKACFSLCVRVGI